MIVIAASCAKPEIEPEKPVTKTGGPEWVLTQTTQSGSGIIYNVQISNDYLYIFANTNKPIRVKWQNLYYVVRPENQFSYWTDAAPNGQPMAIYDGTITISASVDNFGGTVPNLEMRVNNDDGTLPWYSTQKQIYDAKQKFQPIASVPWAQPKPSSTWSKSSFVTQYETRMYDITRKNGDYSNM